MTCVSNFLRCALPGWRVPSLAGWVVIALTLTGCAGRSPDAARGPAAYVVRLTATRSADHAEIVSAAVPVALGGNGSAKTRSKKPEENQPAVPEFVVRLQRGKQPGVYELVTRAAVREASRNKKGKLKVNQRYVGALVPTRLGETQVVSPEADPVHVEARLERR